MAQPSPAAQAALAGWFEFATRHRVLLASVVLLVFPLVMPFKALAVNILIYGLYAVGFNLLYGYLGLLSFGHAALFGTGAYLCGIAIVHFGLPWWAAIVARHRWRRVDGRRHRRLRHPHARHLLRDGDARAGAMRLLCVLSGGRLDRRRERAARHQCPSDRLFGLQLDFVDPLTRYYVVAAFVIAALFVLSRILASPFGAVIEAVRENEARAGPAATTCAATRLVAFALSGGLCGLAGALQALHLGIVPIEIAALRDLGPGRDDGAARRDGHLLRTVRRRRGVSVAGESGSTVDGALATLRRRGLHVCVLFFPRRHLGHPDEAR